MVKKSNQKIFVLVVIGVLTVGVFLYLKVWQGKNKQNLPVGSLPEITSEPVETDQLEINFKQTGNILNWNTATETHTDNWQLVYEKPGSPALSVNLVFDDQSVCPLLADDHNGRRVYIEGIKRGEIVRVVKLTFE